MPPRLLKIVTVLGTRPQFIKSAPVSRALASVGHQEILVHTGQHYDPELFDIFFEELGLPPPAYNLSVGSSSHAEQVGTGLLRLAPILTSEKPDLVLVYGDTNATLTGALAARQLGVPLAHVEAGLRSFNRAMIEETNRVVCDHLSQWLFCPTTQAVRNLSAEGITGGVYGIGDVMLDACRMFSASAAMQTDQFLEKNGLREKNYLLLTLHRSINAQFPERLTELLRRLDDFAVGQDSPVLYPVHPRLQELMQSLHTAQPFRAIKPVSPLGYLDMLRAEQNARVILTDSGGVQKEAAFLKVPCVTLREETEWVETVETGWNVLVGLDTEKLLQALSTLRVPKEPIADRYGDGNASQKIAEILSELLPMS